MPPLIINHYSLLSYRTYIILSVSLFLDESKSDTSSTNGASENGLDGRAGVLGLRSGGSRGGGGRRSSAGAGRSIGDLAVSNLLGGGGGVGSNLTLGGVEAHGGEAGVLELVSLDKVNIGTDKVGDVLGTVNGVVLQLDGSVLALPDVVGNVGELVAGVALVSLGGNVSGENVLEVVLRSGVVLVRDSHSDAPGLVLGNQSNVAAGQREVGSVVDGSRGAGTAGSSVVIIVGPGSVLRPQEGDGAHGLGKLLTVALGGGERSKSKSGDGGEKHCRRENDG